MKEQILIQRDLRNIKKLKKKRLNIGRRVVNILLLFTLCMVFTGCGSGNAENQIGTSESVKNEKGTRNNPYQVGDSIVFDEEMYNGKGESDTSCGTVPFRLSLTLNEVYTSAEGMALMEKEYDSFTFIPVADITFTLTGDYQDGIDYIFSCPFEISVLTDTMETQSHSLVTHDLDSLNTLYTDTAYNVYVSGSYDSDRDEPYTHKYIVISYATDVNGEEKKSIYIELNNTETED